MKVSFTPTLNVLNQMQRTSKAISKSLERLSSGDRVNRAADDSVTLSRDAGMESQVRGLRQGIQNANQAIGMLSTAESAISTQLEIVTKMRELALRASNGTLRSADRTSINTEINQLFQEFQRITNSTNFNGQYLLNGSMGKVGLQIGDKRESGMDQIFMDISNLDASLVFQKTVGTGAFNSRVTYRSAGAVSVVVGDFNGDGIQDLMSSDVNNGEIGVRLGIGDGTFKSEIRSSTGTGSSPWRLELADFNNDGIQDVVASDFNSLTLNVLLGRGDGTFTLKSTGFESVEVGTLSAPSYAVGDINNDGNQDLITIAWSGTAVWYYLGNGDGTFGAQGTWLDNGMLETGSLHVADVDNDGNLDLELLSGSPILYRGRGDGTLNTVPLGLGTFGEDGQFVDLDNDGDLDWLGSQNAYLGDGHGNFGSALSIGSSGNWTVGDFTNDGNLDLVDYNTGTTYQGRGNGTFTKGGTLSLDATVPYYGALADLNGDGVLDFVSAVTGASASSNGLGVLLANPSQASGVQSISAATQAQAQSLLKILDTALTNLRSEQARLGGLHERLDQVVSTNLLRADSIDEARENANSTDIALETANLVRLQILQQAQVAVLAQANLHAKLVIDLLKPIESTGR